MYTYFFLFNFVSQFAVATRRYTDTHTPQDRNTIYLYAYIEGYTHTYTLIHVRYYCRPLPVSSSAQQ